MVRGNHWDEWFFAGFEVRQPLVSMVYHGCPPLVQRWNGCLRSLNSSWALKDWQLFISDPQIISKWRMRVAGFNESVIHRSSRVNTSADSGMPAHLWPKRFSNNAKFSNQSIINVGNKRIKKVLRALSCLFLLDWKESVKQTDQKNILNWKLWMVGDN